MSEYMTAHVSTTTLRPGGSMSTVARSAGMNKQERDYLRAWLQLRYQRNERMRIAAGLPTLAQQLAEIEKPRKPDLVIIDEVHEYKPKRKP